MPFDEIRGLMADEVRLNSILSSHCGSDIRAEMAKTAALNMAADGHLLHDWDYAYDSELGVVDTRPSSSLHGSSKTLERLGGRWRHGDISKESLFGGEHAIMTAALLVDYIVNNLLTIELTVKLEVCERFEYCKWIHKLQKDEPEAWESMLAVAGWLVGQQLAMAMPVVPLAVLLVKRGVLDQWCECR